MAPNWHAYKGPLGLNVWIVQRVYATGDWIPVHVRISNVWANARTLPCDFLFVWLDIGGLFDPGTTWSGPEAAFKEQVLLASNWFDGSDVQFVSQDTGQCGGDMAYPVTLPGRTAWDFDFAFLPRYRFGQQPLPSGIVKANVAFASERQRLQNEIHLDIAAPVEIDGPDPFLYPSPGQLVDATLETPGFQAWLDSRTAPPGWSNTFGDTADSRVNRQAFGWSTPLPDGVAEIGLFANSSPGGDATISGSAFVDPYTGYSYGFWARCANSRMADPKVFGPSGCP
jgi:hypothetical protein